MQTVFLLQNDGILINAKKGGFNVINYNEITHFIKIYNVFCVVRNVCIPINVGALLNLYFK